ncbi:MAG: hypothetical protein LC753_02780, partial [Acidobacteria bacterium]|nr:hypothetical protein [Acidobacteriota bacterium]
MNFPAVGQQPAAALSIRGPLAGLSNRDTQEQWLEELRHCFIVLCDVSTGSDVGATAIDPRMPLPALHATALSIMLAGTYLPDAPPALLVGLEIGLLAVLVFGAVRGSSAGFLAIAIGLAAVLGSVIGASFLHYHRVIPPLVPASARCQYGRDARGTISLRRT